MSVFDWSILGALLLAVIIFCAKLMRRGIVTLDDRRSDYLGRIHEAELKIAEDRKNISSEEHLVFMLSALEDLIRLEGRPDGWSAGRNGKSLWLETPEKRWDIKLAMAERRLASIGRVIHGKGKWLLESDHQAAQYSDCALLMADLNRQVHHQEDEVENLPPNRPVRQKKWPPVSREAKLSKKRAA